MTPVSLLFPRKLRRIVSFMTGALAGLAVDAQEVANSGETLRQIESRGYLRCGVDVGLAGFAERDADGDWQGFDVDLCHAYAAAILGDANAVHFVPLTTAQRFIALEAHDVDILIRNTSWTFARDVGLGFDFTGIAYYDGQGFMVPSDLGVTSSRDLRGARVCVQASTTSALNLADYSATHSLELRAMEYPTAADGLNAYAAGDCDVYTNDLSSLAGLRGDLPDPQAHILLPDVISKEPLGPVIREGDAAFADISRWILLALIAAEELGVTSENARAQSQNNPNPEVRRLLGSEGQFGSRLGLDDRFALRAIEASGNYGQIFDRNLGASSPLQLRRGLNAQWTEGGLLYAPPFR